jgi:predicted phage replisome organizer
MAADNRKYYYLKLKEDFFESDSIIALESMENGYMFSNMLLKLYLRSLKDNGRLMASRLVPYNERMIATATGHNIETVKEAMELFKQLELVDVLDNGAIYMLDIQNFIGESSTEADRIREFRARKKAEEDGVAAENS